MLFFSKFKVFIFFLKNNRLFVTIILLILLRLGNLIPLNGIDHLALKQFYTQDKNTLVNFLNYYNVIDAPLLTPFSLGLTPYINASILFDFLTVIIPSLEKNQFENGDLGKKKLFVYKKFLAFFFSFIQASYLISTLYLYIYDTKWQNLCLLVWILMLGSLITIWCVNLIDEKGLGNGTSLVIFSNIIISFMQNLNISYNYTNLVEIFLVSLFTFLIFLLQQKTYIIDVISARQLSIRETKNDFFSEKTNIDSILFNNGLLIKLNQAGIFPIIVVTNIFPFLNYFFNLPSSNIISKIIYYFLIMIFNYIYTVFFWNPKKITDELRKNSVSILNITPGTTTLSYLERVVYFTSILGGIYLCLLSISFEMTKLFITTSLFQTINISSLLILIGIAIDLQKKLKIININAKYKNKI